MISVVGAVMYLYWYEKPFSGEILTLYSGNFPLVIEKRFIDLDLSSLMLYQGEQWEDNITISNIDSRSHIAQAMLSLTSSNNSINYSASVLNYNISAYSNQTLLFQINISPTSPVGNFTGKMIFRMEG